MRLDLIYRDKLCGRSSRPASFDANNRKISTLIHIQSCIFSRSSRSVTKCLLKCLSTLFNIIISNNLITYNTLIVTNNLIRLLSALCYYYALLIRENIPSSRCAMGMCLDKLNLYGSDFGFIFGFSLDHLDSGNWPINI